MSKDFQINIREESVGAVTEVLWVVNLIQSGCLYCHRFFMAFDKEVTESKHRLQRLQFSFYHPGKTRVSLSPNPGLQSPGVFCVLKLDPRLIMGERWKPHPTNKPLACACTWLSLVWWLQTLRFPCDVRHHKPRINAQPVLTKGLEQCKTQAFCTPKALVLRFYPAHGSWPCRPFC